MGGRGSKSSGSGYSLAAQTSPSLKKRDRQRKIRSTIQS